MDCSMPGLPVRHHLAKFAQTHVIELVMPSNHLVLCCPFLLLSSIFPSIRVFFNESALRIKWPKYNEYSGLISFRTDWLPKGVSRVFCRNTIWKHQFFGAQPSLWSRYRTTGKNIALTIALTLLAKWCLCFLICCLGLSQLFFQGGSIF